MNMYEYMYGHFNWLIRSNSVPEHYLSISISGDIPIEYIIEACVDLLMEISDNC